MYRIQGKCFCKECGREVDKVKIKSTELYVSKHLDLVHGGFCKGSMGVVNE